MRHLPIILASGLLLAACNTVEGLGRDLRTAGDSVEDVAQETRKGQPPAPVETGSTTTRAGDDLCGGPPGSGSPTC